MNLESFKDIRDEMIWKGSALKQIEAFQAFADHLGTKFTVVSSHTSKSIKLPVLKLEIKDVSFYLRDNFYDINLCVWSPSPIELSFAKLFDGVQKPLTWEWYLNEVARCRGYTWQYFTDEEMDDPRILRVFKPHKLGDHKINEWTVRADEKDNWIKRMKDPEWYWKNWASGKLSWEGEFGPGVQLYSQVHAFMQGIEEVVPANANQPYQKGCTIFSLALDSLDHAEILIRNIVKEMVEP